MAEFDQSAWRRGQRQIDASQRRIAALEKKNRASKAGGLKSKLRSGARATCGQGSWSRAGKTPALLLKIHAGGRAGDAYSECQKGAESIFTNMLGRDAKERMHEFKLDEAQHPMVNAKHLFVHVSLSRPASENLTTKQWKEVAKTFMKNIGADGCQYVCTRHISTSNDHVHIVFSRAKQDGLLVSMSHNRWAWRAAVRQVEKQLDIKAVARPAERPASTSDAQVNAARRAQRRGTPQGHISPAVIFKVLAWASTPEQFSDGLNAAGIRVKAAEKNGNTTGILFQKSGVDEWLAGSSISREFSLPKVQAQIELNRQSLLKKEHETMMQRQRDELDWQRQQAQQVQQQSRELY